MPAEPSPPVDRRRFMRASAALTLGAASYSRVHGANERIGVGFIGTGGRAQAHLDIVQRLHQEGQPVRPIAVCDVWDGHEDEYEQTYQGKSYRRKYAQGLYPSARKLGLNVEDHRYVTKDYRRLLECKEIDAVCIATPDHWHARMTIDAARAGKHIYCERPFTQTADEAIAVLDTLQRYPVVMTVGVQALSDPTWREAATRLREGLIGPIIQAQTGIFRSDPRGQWRFYRLVSEMNPRTIDWKLFLGTSREFEVIPGTPLAPELPFDRATFAQWRCHAALSHGIYTDVFTQGITRLALVMGVRYPRRVTAAGGLHFERDGRSVPDIGTLIADYEEGCQLLATASTMSNLPMDEVVRGGNGLLRFIKNGYEFTQQDHAAERVVLEGPKNQTLALWENFLDCVRRQDRQTLVTPELAACAAITSALGWSSYRTGQTLFWDKERRKAVPADGSWAADGERRSKENPNPELNPPDFMSLSGPWTNGHDPAV